MEVTEKKGEQSYSQMQSVKLDEAPQIGLEDVYECVTFHRNAIR